MPSRSIIRTGVGPHREPRNRFPAMAAAINLLARRAARVQSRRNLSRSLSPKLDHSHSITRFDRSRTGPYLQRAPLWQPTVSCAVRFGLGRASDAMPHRRGEPVEPRRPERERLHSLTAGRHGRLTGGMAVRSSTTFALSETPCERRTGPLHMGHFPPTWPSRDSLLLT